MYNIISQTLKEGGIWYVVRPHIVTNDGELEQAFLHRFTSGEGLVSKLPKLGAAFHAIQISDGRVWDVINQFRPIRTDADDVRADRAEEARNQGQGDEHRVTPETGRHERPFRAPVPGQRDRR